MLHEPNTRAARSAELAKVFLKLGVMGFGGPAAHIAMMEDEVVRRRQWLSQEQFLDLLGATNLIPGPNSTEMAIHIGRFRAGWVGLLVAGSCFILPAMFIVLGCAWAYVRLGKTPAMQGLLYGIKPVVIAIILQALWRLARTAVKSRWLGAVGLAGVALSFADAHELIVLFGAGILVAVVQRTHNRQNSSGTANLLAASLPMTGVVKSAAVSAVAASAMPFGLWPLFLVFLKVGAILFGSGYVLLAFLRADLVERWHWLSEAQLLDAIAIGQTTPGPVFTTATFIGYILGGVPAALVATAGIFLPAFVFVALSAPLVPRLRQSPAAAGFLNGVNVASLALMTVVTWQLGRAAITDLATVALSLLSSFLLFRFKLNSAWLVLGGAAVGWLISLWRS